jgi:ribose transport system substrate-binding protein
MKINKARLALALAALLSLPIGACGGSDNGEAAGGGAQQTVKVGVVLKTFNDYFSAMKTGINAMPKHGVDVIGVEAPGDGTDAQAQITAIQNMVTRGAQALAVAPVGPQIQPTREQAVKQGVKVVLIDNDLPNLAGKSSYVGTDNLKGGEVAGKYIKEQMKGTGTLAIMSGIPGVPALDDRVNGVLSQIKGTHQGRHHSRDTVRSDQGPERHAVHRQLPPRRRRDLRRLRSARPGRHPGPPEERPVHQAPAPGWLRRPARRGQGDRRRQ